MSTYEHTCKPQEESTLKLNTHQRTEHTAHTKSSRTTHTNQAAACRDPPVRCAYTHACAYAAAAAGWRRLKSNAVSRHLSCAPQHSVQACIWLTRDTAHESPPENHHQSHCPPRLLWWQVLASHRRSSAPSKQSSPGWHVQTLNGTEKHSQPCLP